jgi:chitinase
VRAVRRRRCIILLLWAIGCRADYALESASTNVQPYADAGSGGAFVVGSTVDLDASRSFDPDGTIRSFRWAVVSEPQTSHATIANENAEAASITLGVVGTYGVELTVTDDHGAKATSKLTIRCVGPTISVNAGPDQATSWRSGVTLSGGAQAEPGFDVTLRWSFVLKPSGSNATFSDPTSAAPTFVADREGQYVVRLTAATYANSAFDDVVVDASVPRQLLSYALVDAEYSKALDRFVIVSDAPPRLRVHDPATGIEATLDLAAAPTSVSVSPNGLRAAVGHDGMITVVNLQPLALAGTFAVAATLTDVIFGNDDRVHCLSLGSLRTVELATSNVTTSISGLPYGRLHPSGAAAYLPTYASSPDDIYRWDVTASPPASVRDSPYHGEYRFGGNLWFTEDGFTLIARSRNLFYSSASSSVDLTYRGVLQGEGEINWATHSQVANRIATLGIDYDANFLNVVAYLVTVYDQQFNVLDTVVLPTTQINGVDYLAPGRFAAYRSDGTRLYVITRATVGSTSVHVLYSL